MNANLRTIIQGLLSAADGSASPGELQKLRVLASSSLMDESDLDDAVEARAAAADENTPLSEIFALAHASQKLRGDISVGSVIQLNAALPIKYTAAKGTYLRAGYYETTDFAPELQPVFDYTVGFSLAHNAGGSTADGQFVDTDGNSLIIYVTRGSSADLTKVWRSIDGGQTWADVNGSAGIPTGTAGQTAIKHIKGVGNASVWLLQTQTICKRSTDGGLTWATVGSATTYNQAWIASNGDIVLIGSGNHTYRRSIDAGATFGGDVALGGSSIRIYVATHTTGGQFVLGGTANSTTNIPAIFVSDDNGASFGAAKITNSIGNTPCLAMCYSPVFGRLYLTDGVSGQTAPVLMVTGISKDAAPTITSTGSYVIASWCSIVSNGAGCLLFNGGAVGGSAVYKEQAGFAAPLSLVHVDLGNRTALLYKNGAYFMRNGAFFSIGHHGVGMDVPASGFELAHTAAFYMRIA
jgi:hypothetical protein